MDNWQQQVRDNLASVRGRMAAACERSGRPADAAGLVAVTKYASAEVARVLIEAGCADLGESRPQSLWTKAEELADLRPRWHMIGHLQRNKVHRTLPLLSRIHSVDSLRLVEEMEEQCRGNDQKIAALLEVNISGDAAKHGFPPEELPAVIEAWPERAQLQLDGLMGMSGLEASRGEAQRQFAELRELRGRLQAIAPPWVQLNELSMGMSTDFEEAIAEGATLVRVGSTLLEGVEL